MNAWETALLDELLRTVRRNAEEEFLCCIRTAREHLASLGELGFGWGADGLAAEELGNLQEVDEGEA
jgi:hypothetical protein